ncbi:WD40 domain-containing putative transcriptional repressor for RNA polymerase II [Encephalitozoon intestinalis ATCC 50506]|uniref:WD40 domain-containing putative transcriptional repressor for RNA polymerase II n=1 Tax=Encephalitozoon intestinalis (strain ATCC 50506) TaxID=876142 RepID=E0S5S3_ENCIT|nr:WD40 domain-containing putative transcriptional repressor for RNA polymerase II [Encephalitozoon intestinalis ATCC 50506]ADM11058.1 WD40 domain-containing putative transcriptional repressor for RNA polymerase II [Encephalitozoon intestinalis ATCC 50506]UTX44708.1 WD40 domain-containing protein [Encephalitozoon intestinalis]
MFQPGIEAYLDAIKQQYDTVMAENRSLRKENIRLVEANGQYARKIQYYTSILNRQKHMSLETEGSFIRPPKYLKRGSDWSVDGDKLCIVSVRDKIMVGGKITNAVISKCGKFVAFGCGYKVFIVMEKTIWFLDTSSEKMERYEEGMFEGETQEYRICPMDFTCDSLYLYAADGKGAVRIWSLKSKAQEGLLRPCDPVALKITNNLVFTIEWDKTMNVYDSNNKVLTLSSEEEFSGPMAVSPDGSFVYAVVGRTKILVFDIKTEMVHLANTNEDRILAIATSPEHAIMSIGGHGRNAYLYRIKKEKPLPRVQDSIDQRGTVFSLGFIGNHLLVGQPEGVMIWDLSEKRSMRIQLQESNVIGISTCKDSFATVDNNGVLRVWRYYNSVEWDNSS